MAKKMFPCGHKRKGRCCHECERLRKEQAAAKESETRHMTAKKERKERILSAPISLMGLPNIVQDGALKLLENLKSGLPCHRISHAKRFVASGQRDVILVRIGRGHRLICREISSGMFIPEWEGSHEAYNKRYSKVMC